MAKPDKAQITYKVGAGDTAKETVLRFHSVVTEEHEAYTELTKFPVQTGFEISNHTVKKNRKVTIRGVITNHLIVGAEEFHEYGSNNSRIMFTTLKGLIKSSTPCEVQTNLDTYTPVVFTRFKTKQQAGATDILDFTLTGEELQLGSTVNQTTPTLLSFTPLTDVEREARIDELGRAGIFPPATAKLSQATFDPNQSFSFESVGENGKSYTTTYENTGYDHVRKTHEYMVHTSDTEVAEGTGEGSFNWVQLLSDPESALPDIDLPAGASTASACIKDGAIGLTNTVADDFIDTARGELRKSVYGAAYGVFGVNGDRSAGQILLALGRDCLVAGAIGTVDSSVNSDDYQGNELPTVEDALEGAKSIGEVITTDIQGVSSPAILTKISETDEVQGFFGAIL